MQENILSLEETMALVMYSYKESQGKIERLTNSLKVSERAFEEYKKRYNDPHRLYVEKVKKEKKARRLRRKAKGPRK